MRPIQHPASFRDPNGTMFTANGILFRQINQGYADQYRELHDSGLLNELQSKGLLIGHKEVDREPLDRANSFKIIEPDKIPFISYPYEWCFSQLKSAAQLTLIIQEIALDRGMTLKDASAFNVQFSGGSAVFIDTLSFEKRIVGGPWIAYRQFCQHFLAPLLMMSMADVRLGRLAQNFIDGVPLDLASRLLPLSSYFRTSVLAHIHLHAKAQIKYGNSQGSGKKIRNISENGLRGLIDDLKSLINRLEVKTAKTEWSEYYQNTNYSGAAFKQKESIFRSLLALAGSPINLAIDFGANDGTFSRIAAEYAQYVVSADIDPIAVENNFNQTKKKGGSKILPLFLDLTNPSPEIGWNNAERQRFFGREKADLTISLALIHHLAIANNLSLEKLAEFYAEISNKCIIEFIPKEDSQVQKLLMSREDVFANYNVETFERAFEKYFQIVRKCPIPGSLRVLYLMEKN